VTNCSLTLREENKMEMLEKMALKGRFGPVMAEQESKEFCIMRSIICTSRL
jgi:hypothetical protein